MISSGMLSTLYQMVAGYGVHVCAGARVCVCAMEIGLFQNEIYEKVCGDMTL